MSTLTTITTRQAAAALAAIKAQYPGDVYCEPTLIWNYTDSGHPAIVWEEGPDDWPFLIGGGTSETVAALYFDAVAEFGVKGGQPPQTPAAKMPAGVFAEPVNHIVLGLYPA